MQNIQVLFIASVPFQFPKTSTDSTQTSSSALTNRKPFTHLSLQPVKTFMSAKSILTVKTARNAQNGAKGNTKRLCKWSGEFHEPHNMKSKPTNENRFT